MDAMCAHEGARAPADARRHRSRPPVHRRLPLCEILRRDQATIHARILVVTGETRAGELSRARRSGAKRCARQTGPPGPPTRPWMRRPSRVPRPPSAYSVDSSSSAAHRWSSAGRLAHDHTVRTAGIFGALFAHVAFFATAKRDHPGPLDTTVLICTQQPRQPPVCQWMATTCRVPRGVELIRKGFMP
mgnify:CR=1 FL=1